VPHREDHLFSSPLETLAEASAELHWGTEIEEVEAAARHLRALNLNPALCRQLQAKAARMRTIDALLQNAVSILVPFAHDGRRVPSPTGGSVGP